MALYSHMHEALIILSGITVGTICIGAGTFLGAYLVKRTYEEVTHPHPLLVKLQGEEEASLDSKSQGDGYDWDQYDDYIKPPMDEDGGEHSGSNAAAGELSNALKKMNVLVVTTLPQFQVSQLGDITKKVTVNGRDVVLAGEGGGGGTPHYAGQYNIVGFRHSINESGAQSEFKLMSAIK